jgi:hypothetical protein
MDDLTGNNDEHGDVPVETHGPYSDGDGRLRVNLDYNMDTSTPQGQRTNWEVTENYLTYAVQNTHKDGLQGQMRRTFARLQAKIDRAADIRAEEIQLAVDERDLLRKSFADCLLPAAESKYFLLLETEVERATKP